MEFPKGIFFNKKHDKAPGFVLGGVYIQRDVFIEWLQDQPEHVRLSALESKKDSTKAYFCVDDYKKDESEPSTGSIEKPADYAKADDGVKDDLPF